MSKKKCTIYDINCCQSAATIRSPQIAKKKKRVWYLAELSDLLKGWKRYHNGTFQCSILKLSALNGFQLAATRAARSVSSEGERGDEDACKQQANEMMAVMLQQLM